MTAIDQSNSSKKTTFKLWSTKYSKLVAPILSITIMVLGMGSLSTYTTLRLHNIQAANWIIGLVSAAYFVGLAIGGYKLQHLVLRVGHIRTFAACSAVFAFTCLIQGLIEQPYLWILFRFIAGLCLAGCFLVTESWLLGASTRKNRGIVLAIYMLVYYFGQGLGQLILKLSIFSVDDIYTICAIFFILAILPVTVTRFHAPYAEEPSMLDFKTLNKKAPLAIWAAFVSGFILSAIYSLYPLYLSNLNWTQSDVATFMSLVLIGAAAAQFPAGRASDIYDRRLIIAIAVGFYLLFSILLSFFSTSYYSIMALSMLIGSAAFVIYPLSINHAVDSFSSKDIISATAGIMMAFGAGSSIGPSIVSMSMHLIGNMAYIFLPSTLSFIFVIYAIYKITYFAATPEEFKGNFSPVTDTTLEIVQMDLSIKDKDIAAHHVENIE